MNEFDSNESMCEMCFEIREMGNELQTQNKIQMIAFQIGFFHNDIFTDLPFF